MQFHPSHQIGLYVFFETYDIEKYANTKSGGLKNET